MIINIKKYGYRAHNERGNNMQTYKQKIEVKICDKLLLSFREAALYSSIGENKLRKYVADHPNVDWIIHIGSHIKIKRPLFEKWLDKLSKI